MHIYSLKKENSISLSHAKAFRFANERKRIGTLNDMETGDRTECERARPCSSNRCKRNNDDDDDDDMMK